MPSCRTILLLFPAAVLLGWQGRLPAQSQNDSEEQGQTSLSESFANEYEEALRKAEEGEFRFRYQFRSFFLSRKDFDDTRKESWAAGGWVGAKTSYLADRYSFGTTAYTSQHLDGDLSEDGTGLLAPGQSGYDVLGELFTDIRLTDALHFYGGRKEYDTPYLNGNDSRMTPNTFEAASLIGITPAGKAERQFRYGAGFFNRIKERNSDEFVSMATAAGARVERGVAAAGVIYESGEFSMGAIDYLSPDIINIFHTEMKVPLPLHPDLHPLVSIQFSDQRSTGDELLTGAPFEARLYGIKAEAPVGPVLLSTAWTRAAGDSDLRSPWSGNPSFTNVQYGDYNRAGEEALLFRAAYDFEAIPGLSAYVLWVNGSTPDATGSESRDEGNLNLEWTPAGGHLKGLSLRVRYAKVTEHGPASRDLEDFRTIVNYGFEW